MICSEQWLDLVPLKSQPEWSFDQRSLKRLPGAHGQEIVRSVYIDSKVCSFNSCLIVRGSLNR